MKSFTKLCLPLVILSIIFFACQQSQKPEDKSAPASNSGYVLDRTSLPIKEPDYAFDTTLDARNAKAPARFEVKAPPKAPNVGAVLIDDQGFGQSSGCIRIKI